MDAVLFRRVIGRLLQLLCLLALCGVNGDKLEYPHLHARLAWRPPRSGPNHWRLPRVPLDHSRASHPPSLDPLQPPSRESPATELPLERTGRFSGLVLNQTRARLISQQYRSKPRQRYLLEGSESNALSLEGSRSSDLSGTDSLPDSLRGDNAVATRWFLRKIREAWGSSFKRRSTWRDSWPCSRWYGLVCSPPNVGFNVVGLVLVDQGLRGLLPAHLYGLANLTNLNISSTNPTSANVLSGGIPSPVSRLTNLQILLLQNLGLSGRILPALANLKRLRVLSLVGNNFRGNIPLQLSSLTNLNLLDLGFNSLSGPIPAQISALSSLQYLALYGNKLSGRIPPQVVGSLLSLTYLVLGSNSLSGPIPAAIGRLTELQVLDLGRNRLSGMIPGTLFRLTNLFALVLTRNSLTGPIPATVSRLNQLQILDLSVNRLNGSIPWGMGSLAYLGYLLLGANSLTGTIPASLGQLKFLGVLSLTRNRLGFTVPSALSTLSFLSRLDLSRNRLAGALPNIWQGMLNLKVADISFNQLTGRLPLPPAGVALVVANNYFVGSGCVQGARSRLNCRGNCSGQRPARDCAAFCGTTSRVGACSGRGICVRGALFNLCVCAPGYYRPPRSPGTCKKL